MIKEHCCFNYSDYHVLMGDHPLMLIGFYLIANGIYIWLELALTVGSIMHYIKLGCILMVCMPPHAHIHWKLSSGFLPILPLIT